MFTDRQLRSFWSKVDVKGEDDCWEWTAARNQRGRPVFQPRTCQKLGISYSAYRISWILFKGEIPEGQWVLHTCDNPACINPKHLFLGTAKQNTRDMFGKGRSGKSKLVPSQVLKIRDDPRPRRIIAKEYGVTLNMVQKIKSGHSWRHLWISNQ